MNETEQLAEQVIRGEVWEEAEHIWENGDLSKRDKYHKTVRELFRSYIFKTPFDTKRLYIYNDEEGIYSKRGEALVNKLLEYHIGKFLKTHDKNEIVSKVKQRTYFKRPQKPENPWLILLENGIYDLKNEELLDFSPEYFFTSKLPFPYDPDAEASQFFSFLPEVVAYGFIPIVQEVFGYCLYRNYPFRKFFMFLGKEGIGKSVLLEVLRRFLGKENVSHKRLQRIGERFQAKVLQGKYANICDDLPRDPIHSTGRIKVLTGGFPVQAETKDVQNQTSFLNTAKLVFSANTPPKLRQIDNAFVRRAKPIKNRKNWEEKIPRDELLAKLTTKEEFSGIFNWAVQGLKRVIRQRGFFTSEETKAFKDEWLLKSAPLHVFCKNKVEKTVRKFMPKGHFYQNLAQWCEHHSVVPPSKTQVGKTLPQHLPGVRGKRKRHRGKVKRCWIGIGWKEGPPATEKNEVETRQKPETL